MKKCPYCAEDIQDAAIVCRYCGRNLTNVSIPQPRAAAIQEPKTQPRTKNSGAQSPKNKHVLLTVVVFLCLICICVGSLTSKGGSQSANTVPSNTQNIEPSLTTLPSIATSTTTFTPTLAPPATQTAQAKIVAQTQTVEALAITKTEAAYISTATRQALLSQKTATAEAKNARATVIASYKDINRQELINYADNHVGELVKIRISVFNIVTNQELQGYFAGTYDAVYVQMSEPFSGIYENTNITVYGIVGGNQCGTNAFGGTICQPLIMLAFYEK